MTRKGHRGKKEVGIDELIDYGISQGLEAISERHPLFKYNQEFIVNHIDKKKLKKKRDEIYNYVKERDGQVNPEYILNELADYVATGAAFDKHGKKVIIDKIGIKETLEEKAQSSSWWDFFSGTKRNARAELDGINYLDNVTGAVGDLYNLFKTGDYAQRMPELAEAVTTVKDMGFLDPALEILDSYGLMDKNKYNLLKKSIKERTEESMTKVIGGIERYINPQQAEAYQKAAAYVFGFLGIGILLASGFGNNITGNVIGNLSNFSTGLIGGGLFLIALVLFFMKFNKKKRR